MGTLYKKGQLVVSIKTDDSGVARSGNLLYGTLRFLLTGSKESFVHKKIGEQSQLF